MVLPIWIQSTGQDDGVGSATEENQMKNAFFFIALQKTMRTSRVAVMGTPTPILKRRDTRRIQAQAALDKRRARVM